MSIQTVTALIPHQTLSHGCTLPTIVNSFSPMRRVQTQSMLFHSGACWRDSGIRVADTLGSQNFKHHPAIQGLLGWFVRHGADFDLKAAAANALKVYQDGMEHHKPEVNEQLRLFGEEDVTQ